MCLSVCERRKDDVYEISNDAYVLRKVFLFFLHFSFSSSSVWWNRVCFAILRHGSLSSLLQDVLLLHKDTKQHNSARDMCSDMQMS